MKKILVPTDFSEHAEYAVEVAASIARKTGARLYLLHIMDIPVYDRNDSFQSHADVAEGIFWMKRVKKQFKELIAKPFLKDVNVVEVLQFDGVYQTIATQAAEHEIDLIVMGSHGDSGMHEYFIGSNTEKVVRLAECPVLTIKGKMNGFEPKNIVFASNFLGEASSVFDKLFDFYKIFDAHVHLLYVNTPDLFATTAYAEKHMQAFIDQFRLKNVSMHIYNEQSVEEGIIGYARRINADLISMETHGRSGLSRLFNPSRAESIVNHANGPVLTVKIKAISPPDKILFPEEK